MNTLDNYKTPTFLINIQRQKELKVSYWADPGRSPKLPLLPHKTLLSAFSNCCGILLNTLLGLFFLYSDLSKSVYIFNFSDLMLELNAIRKNSRSWEAI